MILVAFFAFLGSRTSIRYHSIYEVLATVESIHDDKRP